MTAPNPICIALVDDQELFIESLTALFSHVEDTAEVIWSARSGEEALLKTREQPQVILLDYFFKGKTLDGVRPAGCCGKNSQL